MLIFSSFSLAIDLYSCGPINAPGNYDLRNDVSSNGTCFTINSPNVSLNLNGHTITYATVAIPQIYNFDFEITDPSDPTHADGWDFSQAQFVERVYGEYYSSTVYSGNYSIRVPIPSPTDQEVTSTNSVLLLPGINYAFGGMFYNGETPDQTDVEHRGGVIFQLIDPSDNIIYQVDANTITANRGFVFLPRMFTSSADIITVSSPTNARIRIRFVNLATSPAGHAYVDYMILMANGYSGVNTNLRNYNTITNGTINQSQKYCRACNIINADSARYLELSYLETHFGGIDSEVLGAGISSDTGDGYGAHIHHNKFIHNNYYRYDPIDLSPWRMDAHAIIAIPGKGDSHVSIHDNLVWGSPAWGIRGGDNNPGGSCDIYNNDIRGEAKITNAFGIMICYYGAHVYNNTINLTSGRGIGMRELRMDANVHDNYVYLTEKRPQEQQANGLAYGVQFECGINPVDRATCIGRQNNFRFYNNHIEVFTNPDGAGAAALRNSMYIANGEIYNNTFIATNLNPSNPNIWASAFDSYDGEYINVKSYNNTYKSNHRLFTFEDVQAIFNTFESETLERSSNPINYRTIVFMTPGGAATFLDTKIINNASFDSYQFTANAQFTVKWFLDIKVVDQALLPINGASISIRDRNNNLVYSGITDASGSIRTNQTEYVNVQGAKTYYSPYNVTVIYNAETQVRTTTLNTSKIEVFTFTSGCTPMSAVSIAINEWYNGIRDMNSVIEIIKNWKANGC